MTWDGDDNRLELWHDCTRQAQLRSEWFGQQRRWVLYNGHGNVVFNGDHNLCFVFSESIKSTAMRMAEVWARDEAYRVQRDFLAGEVK